MAKIPTGVISTVSVADIQQQINEIEFLLEGRLDSNNIQRDGDLI